MEPQGRERDGNGLDPEQRNLGFLGVWTFLGASQYERKQSPDFLNPPAPRNTQQCHELASNRDFQVANGAFAGS